MIVAIPKNFSEQKAYRKQITNANIPVLLLCGYLFTSQRKLILIIRPIPMANMKNPTAFRSVNHMFPPPLIPVIILSAMIPSTSSIMAALNTVVPT